MVAALLCHLVDLFHLLADIIKDSEPLSSEDDGGIAKTISVKVQLSQYGTHSAYSTTP